MKLKVGPVTNILPEESCVGHQKNERNPDALLVVREGSLSRLGQVSCTGSASPHVMGTGALPPEELKTVTNSDTPCLITTADGIVETGEEAAVYIKEFGRILAC